MRQQLKDLAIGQSDVSAIINNNCVYVDKTKAVYDLIRLPSKYFLSRPRRFGKSTLISTFYEIFKGNKELFKEQWIYNSPWTWESYPIIRFDFNGVRDTGLQIHINHELKRIAQNNGIADKIDFKASQNLVFRDLIIYLSEKYNKPVVVLIDEYDKPILDVIDNVDEAEKTREAMKSFYGVMKGLDEYLRFVFLTGVTRFSKVGVFGDLNNLNDISMDSEYSDICGITQDELEYHFKDYIEILANKNNFNYEMCLAEIKRWYNGFNFSKNAKSVYNPFSTLNLFYKNDFSNYWFVSGSPTFLIKLIKKEQNLSLQTYDNIILGMDAFDTFEVNNLNLTAILFQTGYLTIKNYDSNWFTYTLGYTNFEIERSFKNNLFDSYFVSRGDSSSYLLSMAKSFNNGEIENAIDSLKQIFLNLDYDIKITKEQYFQNTIYLIFQLLGYFIKSEYKTERGRIDAIIFTDNATYIFEFKMDKTAQDAMKQIHDRAYYNRFINQNKPVYLLGINFNSQKHIIDDYLIEQV